MTRGDAARLLALCAAFDARTIGESDVLAWQQVLDGFDYETCAAAVVKHYRVRTERIMPAHITGLVRTRTGTAEPGPDVLAALGDCEHGTWCGRCKNIHHAHEACTVLRPNPTAWRRALDSVKRVPESDAGSAS